MTPKEEVMEQTRLIVDTALAVADAAKAMGSPVSVGAVSNAGAELLARALLAHDVPLDKKLRLLDVMVAAVRATVIKAETVGKVQ